MNKMKKFIVTALLMTMLVSLLSGCGAKQADSSTGSDNSNADQKTYKVAAIMMSLGSDFWNMLEEGCLLGADEANCTVDVMAPTSESDVSGQVNLIEDCLTKGYNAIIISPIDSNAVKPVLQRAADQGIKVITVNTDVAQDAVNLREAFVGISNYDAGAMLGKKLLEDGTAKQGTKVAILRGLLGIQAHDERVNGLKETLEAAGCEIVTVQAADSDRGKAVTIAENILESNPNVDIFYCTNDEMALGAYQAVQGRQSKALCIGFDGTSDAFKSISDGKMYASVGQPTIEMGRQSVLAAVDALNGKTLQDNIKIDCTIITQENVAEVEKATADERAKAEALKK